MNITQEQNESKIISIQKEIDQIYSKYQSEEDNDIRRNMRKRWKELIAEYEILTGYNPYRKNL